MAGANGMSGKGGPMVPKGRALPVGVVAAAPIRSAGGAGQADRTDSVVARMRAAAARVNNAKTPEEARAGERAMSAAIRSLRAARGATARAPKAPAAASRSAPKAAARPARRAGTTAAKKGPVKPATKPAAKPAAPAAKPKAPTAKPVYKHGGFEVAPNGRGGFALSHPKTGLVLSDALTKNYAKQLARYYSDPKSGKSAFDGALKGNKKDMDWVANWTAEGARRSAPKLKSVH